MKHNGNHRFEAEEVLIDDHERHNSIRNRVEEADLHDEEKIRLIAEHFKQILLIMGLNLNDDSLRDTPKRVATMYIKEAFSGLDLKNVPQMTLFENKYLYNEMLVEKNVTLFSYCEHHFVPIIGKAHVAYIPNKTVIGLSKINRLVEFYAKRPQLQERLTNQIADGLKSVLHTEDVAVVVDAVHLCVAARGVRDTHSSTFTAHYSGKFKDDQVKNEFLFAIR